MLQFTGPLSMLGFYWTVFIFLGSESKGSEYDAVLYRANGEPVGDDVHSTYSVEGNIIGYGMFGHN